MKTPNPAREAARDLARQISKMSPEAKAAFIARFPAVVTIEGRPLSPINTALVATQCATATVVGGFRQWLKAGRCVMKGQKGLWIWVPTVTRGKAVNWMTGQQASEESEETRFILAPVFDVSQTAALDDAAAELPAPAPAGWASVETAIA